MGWRPPEDRSHERRYALVDAMPVTACPVVIGVEWYERFDQPERRDGAYWIGLDGVWGDVRGGHAVCLRPPAIADLDSAWLHYDQGEEGACAGFAAARAASLCNRRLYDGFKQYEAAQRNDEWAGEGYFGTSVNGALQGLRLEGAWPVRAGKTALSPRPQAGVTGFLWAKTVQDVTRALKTTEGFVRVLNSWGNDYPREVRMPLTAVEKLLAAGGEFGVPLDRVGR